MSENKRRNANAVPVASFVTWAIIGVFACVGGLGFVWVKNDLHRTGAVIKALERELHQLENDIEVSSAHIAQLSSTKALQDRFDTGFTKLQKITDDQIVAIPVKPADQHGSELRAVSNERARK